MGTAERIDQQLEPITQTAVAFDVTPATIRRWVVRGDLQRVRIGQRSYILRDSINELITRGRTAD